MAFIRWVTSLFSKPTTYSQTKVFAWQSEWTEALMQAVSERLPFLSKASDLQKMRFDYHTLSDERKVAVWVEFFKTLAFYESGYNPNSQSVDVGVKHDRDTWSIGLLQLSVVDQMNYGLNYGYTFNDLLNPINNLKFGVLILANQILKRGKIFIPNDEKGNPKAYFATLRPGNKYSKVAQITATVEALKFYEELGENLLPWLRIAETELNQSEIVGSKHNPRIVEYHSATTLKAKDDETAWCASFVCWVLEKAGYKSTDSAWARDYLNYGQKCDPQYGCVVVFSRGSSSGHVGFYVKSEGDYIHVLGGNQSNQVNVSKYPKSRVLGYRWPVK